MQNSDSGLSIVEQMLQDGSLPDKPVSGIPMRAVVAAASTMNPDKEAQTLQLAQRSGMGADLTRSNPEAARQRATAADLNVRDIEIRNPILARQLSDPNFAAVAHDDLDSLTRISQGAATLGASRKAWAETQSAAGNINRAFFGAFKPFIDAGGVAVQGALETPKALMYGLTGLDPDWQLMQNVWTQPRTFKVQEWTNAVQNWLSQGVIDEQPEYRIDPATQTSVKNPDYRWYGRGLVNALEQVPGALSAFALTGRVGGAAGGGASEAEGIAGAVEPGAALESQSVPAVLSTQAAQTTYSQARAKGADQHTAIVAALASGLTNYTLMGKMPGSVPTSTLRGAVAQWAGRSAGMGTAMTAADNAIAQGYDPDRGLMEGWQQSVATMAAFEGVGFIDHVRGMTEAVEQSKLRTRSPEMFQRAVSAEFEGQESLRIPAEDFVNYFHEKGVDPAEVANQVGVTNLAEAAAAGSDLEIPKANYFGKLDPEHQKGLLQDIVDPATEMTARQAQAGRDELDQWIAGGGVEKLQAEYQQADAETQATPEWKSVYSDLKQRYLDAGETEPAAENYATLQANAIANLARKAGMKPDELMKLHNPNVVVGGEAPGAVLNQGDAEGAEDDSTLYQGGTGDDESMAARKARNIAMAKIQGEILNGGEGKRGWFKVLPDGRVEIGKTKIGDVSTFIHEPAHAYLELFRELTQHEGASEPLKDDFEKITNWLGTTPEDAYKNGFTREQHEQWARANEQYVREGKAPTAGLRRAFHNFSVWLGSIYRRASALGVELNGDIRGVMDRLYAGEDAVHRAEQETGQPLFENPEDAAWTEEQYRNYADAKGVALDKAREQVRAELNDAAVRERTQDWREEKSNVRDAVTEQVDARPEYTAIRSLRRGSLDEGTALTLNRDALVKQFGEDRVSALQRMHRGLYRNEGGTDADTAAELLGFNSGEEMMRALETAPRRALAIEQAVRNRMTERHGDVRYDGSLDDKARLAVENNERATNLHRELSALRAKVAKLEKKAADSKAAMRAIATLPLEQYQEAARQIIDSKTIADLQPYRYLNASRRFSREAFDALKSGDARKAADAKNKELLNHFLFREASAASEYVDKFESYVKRVQGRGIQQRLGLADENVKNAGGVGDFRDQFNWLMARYRLGGTDRAPERTLRDWADDVYSQGNEVAIAPGVLNEGRFVDYRNAPISEIRDVHDALVNIRHLAQRQFKMFVQGKQVEFADARIAMVSSARDNLKSNPVPVLKRESKVPAIVRGFLDSVTASTRMEFLINKLDGGSQGPWHDFLWNRYQDSKGVEMSLQHEVTKSLNDQLEAEATRQGLRLMEKVSIDGIPPNEQPTRKDLVSFALNMGNEGNLDRLRKSFSFHGWDPAAVERIRGMMTREEWQFVQRVWDTLKPMGERMKDMEQRLTGLPPAMVKVTPFKVALADGAEMELGGGYFPIKIDPEYSLKGYQDDTSSTAQNLMQTGYGRATTSRGYTKERTGFGGPLLFDYERVLSSHIAKAAKDISHREFMMAANKLLTDPEIRQTLRETLGSEYEEQFMPWLRATVNDRNGSLDFGSHDPRRFMGVLRSNIVKASLAFKASTSLLQFTHLPRIMLFTKPGAFTQAMVDFLKSPLGETAAIRELSPNEMRFRGDNLDRDYRAKLQEIAGEKNVSAAAVRLGYAAFKYVDHLISFPLWKSVYNQAMSTHADLPESEAHMKAVHEADAAVRMGLGTSTPGDLPPLMRSDDSLLQLETMLFGFHNLNWNIGRHKVITEAARDLRGGKPGAAAGKLTAGVALAWFLPAVLSSYVTGQGPEDGENWGLWAAKRSLLFAGGTLPWVKDVTGALEHGSLNPIASFAQKGIETAKRGAAGNLSAADMGIDALDFGGHVAGIPGTAQAVHTLRYMRRANEGKVDDPSMWGAIVSGH